MAQGRASETAPAAKRDAVLPVRQQGEQGECLLSIAFIERLFVEEAVSVDAESIQRVADCVTELTARRQNEDSAGLNLFLLDALMNDLGDPLCFFLHALPLEHEHFAFRVLRPRYEHARSPLLIVCYQGARQFDYAVWAPATFVKFLVVGFWMCLIETGDTVGMRMLEGVDGLIFVADHDEVSRFGQHVQKNLFRPVQILVLVNEDMLERGAMGRRWVLPQIAEGLGHKFADEHCLMEPKPPRKLPFKNPVDGFNRPAGRFGLETCPRRVEGLQDDASGRGSFRTPLFCSDP